MVSTTQAHTHAVAKFAAQTPAAASAPAAGVQANAGLIAIAPPVLPQGATVLTVGDGKEFSTIGAAIAAAPNGAVILVDAGTYTNDFATVSTKITLIGVGGMVNMVATEPPPNYKGILTVDNDVTIKNFSFSGCAIPDAEGGNGAGIRYEGGQMVLQNDSFIGNQNGIMGAPSMGLAVNTVKIDHCLFSGNGSGTGGTHNLYIGDADSLTATNSVFEYANVGHEFKSRALVNNISGNVFYDGPTGTASYDIDLPNGGNDTVTNNYIEKGADAQNDAMVHFGGEGIPYAGSQLTLSDNVFQNDRGSSAVGVLNQTAITVAITGNEFVNFADATIDQGPATETGNVDGNGDALANSTLSGVLPGSTMVITDGQAHSVVLQGTLEAVEGGSGLLTAYALGGHIVVIGGSGGMDFSESPTSGGNQITTAAGSSNSLTLVGQDSVDSEGNDTIVCGLGNITATINGNALISDGTGNNQWTVNGTATITGQGGNPLVSAGAHADVVVNGTVGALGLTNNGGSAAVDIVQGGTEEAVSITGGALNLKVYGACMNVTTAPGTAGAVLRFGVGNTQVNSNGDDVIWAGSGASTIIVTSAAQIHAGSGALSLFGHGASGASFYGNGGTYLLSGDSGDITYYGGSLDSTLNLQLSSNTIVGGSGLLTIDGGSREMIYGGSGGIVLNQSGGQGSNTITTAAGSSNVLTLDGADVVTSWGHDTIDAGSGNQSLAIHGNSIVTGSTGNSTLTFWGHDTLIGRGQDQVTVQSGADGNITAGTLTTATEAGGTIRFRTLNAHGNTAARTIVTGGSATVSNGAAATIDVTTNAGSSTNVLMQGGAVDVNSNGNDIIQAGSGSDIVTICAGDPQIWGGSGSLAIHDNDTAAGDRVTVHGGSGSLSYDQGPGALNFIGGSGTAVINGEYGSMVIQGGSGNLTVTGGGAGEQFTAGSGTASVALTSSGANVTFGTGNTTVQEAGYGGPNVFWCKAGDGGGTDVITGFRPGDDQFVLQGVSVASEQMGSASTLVAGGSSTQGLVLTLTDGTHLVLAGFGSPLG